MRIRREPRSRRRLRDTLRLGGAVAVAAGLHSAVAGARSIPGPPSGEVSVDSEVRYYGVFYAAYGVALARGADGAVDDPLRLQRLLAPVFLGGVARAGGWLARGAPDRLQRALLAVEIAVPLSLVAWQRRLR